MRFSLIDLIIFTAFAGISSAAGLQLSDVLQPQIPGIICMAAAWVLGLLAYLAAACPLYRRFRWRPLLLPRCPHCNSQKDGFQLSQAWPRINYKCLSCSGEFVIWHSGRVTEDETWDKPVLAIKWPYVFGVYKRMSKHLSGIRLNVPPERI